MSEDSREKGWNIYVKASFVILLLFGVSAIAFAIFAVVQYIQSFETFFPVMEAQVPVDTSQGSIVVKQAESVSDLRGQFGTLGDVMGGLLNPVLTFATFIVLIATILIQLKELRLTREELKNSNLQLELSQAAQKDSARALEAQVKTQLVQQFDAKFFNLIDILVEKETVVSPKVSKYIFSCISDRSFDRLDADTFCSDIFEYTDELNSYTLFFFHLLDLIDSNDLEDCDRYVGILRSIISNDMRLMLMFSGYEKSWGKFDNSLFRELAARLSFFDDLDFSYYFSGMEYFDFDSKLVEYERIKNLFYEKDTSIDRHKMFRSDSSDHELNRLYDQAKAIEDAISSKGGCVAFFDAVYTVVKTYDQNAFGGIDPLKQFLPTVT